MRENEIWDFTCEILGKIDLKEYDSKKSNKRSYLIKKKRIKYKLKENDKKETIIISDIN